MIEKTNPLNIRYVRCNAWQGQIGFTKGFCKFLSLDYGIRAACVLLMRQYRMIHCTTVHDIIYRFAPPSENDSEHYIDSICDYIIFSPYSVLVDKWHYACLIRRMAKFETGSDISIEHILNVMSKFNIEMYEKK